jgi:hypothetical protein
MKLFLSFITIVCYSITMHAQTCTDPVIANGECTPTFTFPSTVTWVANPNSVAPNTSSTVGQYADDGTNGWDNLLIDYGTTIDLSTNNYLHMDIYTPAKSAQVLAKLEGGTSAASEKWSPHSGSTTNWVHFVFDFSDQSAANHQQIALFFDASQTGGTNPTNYYFDNLQWASGATLSADKIAAENGIQIFPNPAATAFKVESLDTVKSYRLSDITGRTLLSEVNVGASSFSVDISHLDRGVYLLDVHTPTASKNMKLIKR